MAEQAHPDGVDASWQRSLIYSGSLLSLSYDRTQTRILEIHRCDRHGLPEVVPSKVPGVYRHAVYDWFARQPPYLSGTGRTLGDAKNEAELAHLVGYVGLDVKWQPGAGS